MADQTLVVLREIREELMQSNRRLDRLEQGQAGTNEQLAHTNERLERLERRQTETEVRLASELVAVVGAIQDLKDAVVADRGLRRDVADHERRIGAIESRGRRKSSS